MAWIDLNTCRREPHLEIPWTAIDRYARRHAIDEDEFEWFVALLRRMDAEYFKFQEYKRQISAPKGGRAKAPIKTPIKRPRKKR